MAPALSFPARPAPYIVTADSPSTLNESHGLTHKTLLVFQDLEASKTSAAGRTSTYRIDTTVAKLLIHNVSDLTIIVSKGVVTTLEVHNVKNVKLRLEDNSGEQSRDSSNFGLKKSAAYGTVTLDPHLENVAVDFQNASVIGAVVVTSALQAVPDRILRNVTISVDGQNTYNLAGVDDELCQAGELGQHHLYYDGGWQRKGLERQEKEYPSLST